MKLNRLISYLVLAIVSANAAANSSFTSSAGFSILFDHLDPNVVLSSDFGLTTDPGFESYANTSGDGVANGTYAQTTSLAGLSRAFGHAGVGQVESRYATTYSLFMQNQSLQDVVVDLNLQYSLTASTLQSEAGVGNGARSRVTLEWWDDGALYQSDVLFSELASSLSNSVHLPFLLAAGTTATFTVATTINGELASTVANVPLPGAFGLFGSLLIMLVSQCRRFK